MSGTVLATAPGYYVLARSAGAAAAHTGTTAETTLATVSVPAGAMGANGRLKITSLWVFTGAGGTRTYRCRLGGTSFAASGQASTVISFFSITEIININSEAVQRGTPTGIPAGNSAAMTTGTVNTAAAQDLVLQMTLADAGDSATLLHYLVEILPG